MTCIARQLPGSELTTSQMFYTGTMLRITTIIFNAIVFTSAVSVFATAPATAQQATASGDGITASIQALDDPKGYLKAADEALKLGKSAQVEQVVMQALKTEKGFTAQQRACLTERLGEAYLWQGKFKQAAPLFKQALATLRKTSPDSVQMARALEGQGWLQQLQGDTSGAEKSCVEALEIYRKGEPNGGDLTADGLEHLGWLMEEQGLIPKAVEFYREALAMRNNINGVDSLDTANTMEWLADALIKSGKADEAQGLFQSAMKTKLKANSLFGSFMPQSVADTVFFRYYTGSPFCARSFGGGSLTQKIAAGGVIAEASIMRRPSDFAKSLRVNVRITNNSNQPINILSQAPSLIALKPEPGVISMLDPQELANRVEKKGRSKANWTMFWGGQATTTSTTTVIGNGFMPYPYMGGGWVPPNFGYGGGFMNANRSGDMTIMNTSMPDWQARQRAYEKAQQLTAKATQSADEIRQSALVSATVPPGGTIDGALEFDDVKFDQAAFRLPVGNATFQFMFDRKAQ